MALSITELKKGTIFKMDGTPYRVVDYSQKVMGRGGSIVNVRIKSLVDGRVVERTFKGNEQVENADVSNRNVQYLYQDSATLHFMDEDTFEQLEVPADLVGDQVDYMKEGDKVIAQMFDDRVINIELPKNVPLKVEYTEDVVRGDTSGPVTKPARLETGVTVRVPSFVKTGDTISVDTTTGAYRERVK